MVQKLGMGDAPIEASILTGAIEKAQKQLEGQNFNRRKNVISYDDIMNQQRKLIYKQRDDVLDGADLHEQIKGMISSTVNAAVNEYLPEDAEKEEWRLDDLRNRFFGILCSQNDFRYTDEELEKLEPEDVKNVLIQRADEIYKQKEELFGERLREVERVILLRNVDTKWIDHLDAVDDVKGSIGLHAYAQRDPINEFKLVTADMFDEMIASVKESTAKAVLTAMPAAAIERKAVARATADNCTDTSKAEKSRPVVNRQGGIAKNAPCPCGSGKKYKRCCGKDLFKDER
jgi:preprotein translocase subunit SecA